ncbi:HGxxPAAW family protein [Pseudoclavibacter sp. RFBA6]|uniref:HGxxPAAW family protein n=1 Tax=Pseudoclavibacter sp. RFBA6 TaxID=2080573 RepID=UPI0011B07B6D|nr:HGxxPAAW family protein [Pseudoclavibacter sp. RFBA6]
MTEMSAKTSHEPTNIAEAEEVQEAPLQEPHESHGHSVAAWTGVLIMLAGFTVGTLGIWFDQAILTWVGVAAVAVGAVAWPVLARLGFGPKAH